MVEIKCEVKLYHGGKDEGATLAMGEYIASLIPGSISRFFPGKKWVVKFDSYKEIFQWTFPHFTYNE